MNGVRIAAIVEGDGECEAVPVLVRRIAQDLDPGLVPKVMPFRIPASRLLKQGEVERAVGLAARKLQGKGGILIVLDCDWPDGCPAREGPALLRRAVAARTDLPVSVVLAKMEYEAWFLAAAESLRGKHNLSTTLDPPPSPETIRGAKEWLSDRMEQGQSYAATADQAALTKSFDMAVARQRADSFDKCYREVSRLLRLLRDTAP
jgi:hypothetical protein